ncbi:XkdX family protein [Lacticaseibacillus nasuensis]|nr:XkdX family protein [Lacticaseibacillus nasuensis]MCX2455616.1 XkdX family protein [Lacticaseibacillus nasuensis]
MADQVKLYYQMGLYTAADLPLFVSVGWLTQAEADELTGEKMS